MNIHFERIASNPLNVYFLYQPFSPFFFFKISPNFSFANASYRLLLEKEKKKKNEWTILITLILRDSRNNSKSSGYVGSFDGVKDTKASFIILYMYVRKSKFILFR